MYRVAWALVVIAAAMYGVTRSHVLSCVVMKEDGIKAAKVPIYPT